MKTRFLRNTLFLAACFLADLSNASAQTNAKDVPVPKSITTDASLSKAQNGQMIHAGLMFYAFWNTGKAQYLKDAVSTDFHDNTLPEGRPQGFKGVLFASVNFRNAVPDLSCSVEDIIISKDKITCRQVYTGHNSGPLGGHPASGKAIKFIAIDILHVRNGKIFEDWHLEDNLTLLKQAGVVK